jgi:peptidyl-prolyl cis-trans isomerase D
MFDTIRNHRNWLMPLLMVGVVLPFVLSGVYGFSQFLRDDTSVAKIDGETITQQDLEVAQHERIERMVQMLGPNVDTRMFDTPQVRASTLDGMLSDKAIEHEVKHLNLTISDARLKELIGGIPQFQVNGKFDYDTYLRLLASRGFTEASFEARVRTDVGHQVLDSGVTSGSFVPKTVLAQLRALDSERRQIRRLLVKPDDFTAKTGVDEAAIKADYEANKDLYRTPEHAKAAYVVLRLADLAARATVTEAAMRDYYDKNRARWAGVEQRRASHILITVGKDGSAPDKASARKLAEDLQRQVRAKPADFARLAKEKSKDPGSADKGGDLGWFGRAMMTKPFEDAAFALKDGQISDVVETEFGFHIIQITGAKGTETKPFDEVRPTIEAEMRKQAAQKTYAEIADQFTNFVFEQSDGLAAAAAKFQLPLQTVDNLTRQGVPQQPDKAAIFTPAVLDAAFSPDALEKHHNTKAIDIGNSSLVSVHVVDYAPSVVRPLDEIRPAIQAKLQHLAAVKLAREAGEARLAQLRKEPNDTGFEPVHDLSRRDSSFLPAKAITSIMAEAADHLPSYVGVEQPDGAYAIVHVLSVSHADAGSDADRAALEKTWTDRMINADQVSFVQALRDRYDARVTRADLSPPAPKGSGGNKPAQ